MKGNGNEMVNLYGGEKELFRIESSFLSWESPRGYLEVDIASSYEL